jgi:hypothetical protein
MTGFEVRRFIAAFFADKKTAPKLFFECSDSSLSLCEGKRKRR